MAPDTSVLSFGEFELDLRHRELRRRGERVDLKPTPLRVLLYLAERLDRTVSKQELLDTLWPSVIVTDTSLANAINQARRAVGDDGATQGVIRTYKGHGYRFVAELLESTTDAAADAAAGPEPARGDTSKLPADPAPEPEPALEGERKQVTVLFARVRNAMELADRSPADEWQDILGRFHRILNRAVERFEGIVHPHAGEGVLALFGAPVVLEDHAARACYAGLQIREELRRLRERLRADRGIDFEASLGLNSGDVIVWKTGADLRMDHTVQGQAVSLAARAEQLAGAGDVCLTEHTARRVEGYFDLVELGPAELDGSGEPVRVHALGGATGARTRLELSRARGLSTLVDRERELDALLASLDQAAAGNGQVVGLVGEAGVGKSRLCLEFSARCQGRGLRVDETSCPPHGTTEPYGAIRRLLRGVFDLRPNQPGAEARVQLAGRLRELDASLEGSLDSVLDFLQVGAPERPPAGERDRERRLQRFVARVVQARSRAGPCVLLVDDAHWIDDASDAFLAAIAQAVSGTRTLLLVNFRPEYRADWMNGTDYQQLPVRPLERGDADALLLELLGDAREHAPLRSRIAEGTGGVPFFIEEVVQSLSESALTGSRGAYRLASAAGEITLPTTVEGVLASRIDRLPAREKDLLQTAAVIGREVPETLLARVAGLSETELDVPLTWLRRADFLRDSPGLSDAVYEFKHAITRQVAYDSQLHARRAATHASVAAALIEEHGEGASEHGMLIGHHLANAGESLEAARWYLRAYDPLLWRSPREASRCAREVVSLLGDTEALRPTDREPAAALMARAAGAILHAGASLGISRAEADELFRRARDVLGGPPLGSPASDPEVARRMVFVHVTYLLTRTLSEQDSLAHAHHACTLAEQTQDEGVRLFAAFTLQAHLFYLKRYGEAYRVARREIDNGPADPLAQVTRPEVGIPFPRILSWGAHALGLVGDPDQALRLLGDSIQLLRVDGRRIAAERASLRGDESSYRASTGRGIGECVEFASDCYYFLGDGERSVRCARTFCDWVRDMDSPGYQSRGSYQLGRALRLQREWEAFAGVAREMGALRHRAFEPTARAWGAEARAHLGDRTGAVEDAAALLADGAIRRELPAVQSLAHTLIYCDGARRRDAIDPLLERFGDLIEQTEARAYAPFLHELRAQLARACGDEKTCERERREAERLWTRMRAPGHVDRMALELQELPARA